MKVIPVANNCIDLELNNGDILHLNDGEAFGLHIMTKLGSLVVKHQAHNWISLTLKAREG